MCVCVFQTRNMSDSRWRLPAGAPLARCFDLRPPKNQKCRLWLCSGPSPHIQYDVEQAAAPRGLCKAVEFLIFVSLQEHRGGYLEALTAPRASFHQDIRNLRFAGGSLPTGKDGEGQTTDRHSDVESRALPCKSQVVILC